MIFNRIINDIIDWVRRLLYWKQNDVKKKPYTVIETYPCKYGLLKLVDRDTPRAVLTYIYTPKPKTATNVVEDTYDYHICLDHLWAVENPEVPVKSFTLDNRVESFKPNQPRMRRRYGEPTHSITVLKASRWIDPNGDYQTAIVFHQNYNFVGKSYFISRDKYATLIVKDIMNILEQSRIEDLSWQWEIAASQKHLMGPDYIRPEDLPPPNA